MEKQHEVKKPFVAKSCVAPNKRKSVEIMQKTVQKNVRKDLVSSSTARVQPVLIKYGAAVSGRRKATIELCVGNKEKTTDRIMWNGINLFFIRC